MVNTNHIILVWEDGKDASEMTVKKSGLRVLQNGDSVLRSQMMNHEAGGYFLQDLLTTVWQSCFIHAPHA